MNKSKTDILMIHLPDDIKKLRSVVRFMAKELEDINSTAFQTIYNNVVSSRTKETIEREKMFKKLDDAGVFLLPKKKQLDEIKRDLAKFEIDNPQFRPILRIITKCTLSFKGNPFTYKDFKRMLAKQWGVIAVDGKILKALVYAILHSSGIPKVMKYDGRTKKLVAHFNVRNFDEKDSLV